MEATVQTIMVDGKALTMDELNKMLDTFKSMSKTVKAAKKEAKAQGIKLEVEKAPKEKSAEYALLVANFLPLLEAYVDIINKMFVDSRDDAEDITSGQDSISFNVSEEYQVIIRSSGVTKAKKAKRDKEAKAAKTE